MAKADLVTCSFWFCSPLLLFLEDSCKGLDKWMNLVIWSLVIYMKMFGHRHCLESMYEILIESIIHGDCKAARLHELMWSWSGSKQLKHAVGCSLWRGSFAEHLHICTFAHLHICTFACTLSSVHFCCEPACWFACICLASMISMKSWSHVARLCPPRNTVHGRAWSSQTHGLVVRARFSNRWFGLKDSGKAKSRRK